MIVGDSECSLTLQNLILPVCAVVIHANFKVQPVKKKGANIMNRRSFLKTGVAAATLAGLPKEAYK